MRNPLPKIDPLPGTIHEQRVRCGRSNCRCASGEPHSAFYRFWREGGRLRKAYVRKRDLEGTQAACAAWQRHRAMRRDMNAELETRGLGPRVSLLDHMLRKMVKWW